jgi:Na+/proline symporter
LTFCIGAATYLLVRGQSVNFFVAGRSLPLWVVAVTLGAQAVDSNALLGNVDLSYRNSYWDGAVLPLGLGLSLILNGLFLAHHINMDEVLTLPDVFAKRYGRVVEVLVSLATVCSFIMLLAGNLLGFGVVTSYLWNISETAAIWMAAVIIWMYTVGGGLYSVTYTDVCQAVLGWSGCVVFAFYMIANEHPSAPAASIGFPGNSVLRAVRSDEAVRVVRRQCVLTLVSASFPSLFVRLHLPRHGGFRPHGRLRHVLGHALHQRRQLVLLQYHQVVSGLRQ